MTELLVLRPAGGAGRDLLPRGVTAGLAELFGATAHVVDVAPSAESISSTLDRMAGRGVVGAALSGSAGNHDLMWQIITRASKPVVVVGDPARAAQRPFTRALVPLDGTPEAAAAVAGMMARLASEGIELVALHVLEPATVPAFWDHAGHAEQVWEEEFLARSRLDPAARFRLRRGVPGDAILDAALSDDVDLIAVGWSRTVGANHGGVVRHLLAEAPVPVLLMPTDPPDTGPTALVGDDPR